MRASVRRRGGAGVDAHAGDRRVPRPSSTVAALAVLDNLRKLTEIDGLHQMMLRAAGPRVKFSRQNGTTIKKLEALQAVVERLERGKLADRLSVGIW